MIRSSMLAIAVVVASSCGPNSRILESANQNNPPVPAAANSNSPASASSFEQDLNAMRTADFKFIIVFRRKDGQPFDASDKELISKTGTLANRRILSDEGRAVIMGSNFMFVKGEFDELTRRFQMENYSKADSGPMYSNSNSNSNSNSMPVR